jgi:hypothetical protein
MENTDLRDRLADLAARAPVGVPAPDVWQRGRRRQVRRTAAGVAVGAVITMILSTVGAQTWSWTERRTADPVDAPGPGLVLPDHVYTPGPWLEGTRDAGPIGPLVAILGGPRPHWTGWKYKPGNGIAGISTSGVYRYLDLPGWTGESESFGASEVVLSPDGRYVAYWASGPTTGKPVATESGEVTGAVAVYDTVTGDTDQHPISSVRGLAPAGIAWAGNVVRMAFGVYLPPVFESDSVGSRLAGYAQWDSGGRTWSLATQPKDLLDLPSAPQGAGHFVFAGRGKAKLVMGPAGVEERFRMETAVESEPVPSPDGRRVAGIYDPHPSVFDAKAREIVVTDLDRLDADGRAIGTRVPTFSGQAVYGWRDDRHVIAERWDRQPGIYSVDVTTGDATLLMTRVGENYGNGLQIAAEAWMAPSVTASEPSWPWDPRLKIALVAGLVLLCWVLWSRWRRRRGRA